MVICSYVARHSYAGLNISELTFPVKEMPTYKGKHFW